MSSTASTSAATDEQQPSKKKKPPSKGSISIPSLPHDLIVSCLARVSKFHYPTLSLVSKSFRSLLASPELYQTRTLLGRTESCLYVCLQFPNETNRRWFTLCRKPNQTLTNHTSKKNKKKKKESSGNLLAPIPILNSASVDWSDLIAVGFNLYAIRGPTEDDLCSNVSFLDCRTHTWLEGPRSRLAQTNDKYDGMMYLAGSSEDQDSLNCVEVYNTKTQTWKPVPPVKRKFELGNMEGKIYMIFDAVSRVALKPKDLTWEAVGLDTDLDGVSFCMIENIIYGYVPNGQIRWREFGSKGTVWRQLKGLEGLPKFARYSTVKLAGYGGKMVVLWDKYVPASGYKEKMIWCAEISFDKRNKEEILGKVEWCDAVLTVPKSYKFVCAIAATV